MDDFRVVTLRNQAVAVITANPSIIKKTMKNKINDLKVEARIIDCTVIESADGIKMIDVDGKTVRSWTDDEVLIGCAHA
jgi:transaldolase